MRRTWSRLEQIAPGLRLCRQYERAWLRHDFVAGLSVAAVALPTGMAYAQLAGFGPVVGIYACILPLLAYALFGSSRQLITGPDAATCAILVTSLVPLAGGDPQKYQAYCVVLTVLTGFVCIGFGIARLGFLANFLANPILTGFLNGVGITIVVGQLGKVFGFGLKGSDFSAQVAAFFESLGKTHFPTLILGLSLIALLIVLKRAAPRVPGPLLVGVVGIAAVGMLRLDTLGVATIGKVPAGFPTFTIPWGAIRDLGSLFGEAMGVAVVSFTSAMLTARGFAAKNGYDIDADQEFIALGACNVIAGMGQGFAVSGADSRTAVNDAMGGKSQVTGLVAAAFMIAVLFFFTGPLASLPVAALGAILIVSGAGLVDIPALRRFYHISRAEFGLSLTATAAVLLLGALDGVLLTVFLALARVVGKLSQPHEAILGYVAETGSFRDREENVDAQPLPGLILYRFDAGLLFFNADHFKGRVRELVAEAEGPLHGFILDANPIHFADVTALRKLEEIRSELEADGVSFVIARPNRLLQSKFARVATAERTPILPYFPSVREAVEALAPSRGTDLATSLVSTASGLVN